MTASGSVKRSLKDKALFGLIALFVLAGLWAHYTYTDLAWSLQAAGWIVLILTCVGIGLLTQDGQRLKVFANSAKNEVRKVVWPPRAQAMQTTLIVLVVVMIASVILWAMDSLFVKLIGMAAFQRG